MHRTVVCTERYIDRKGKTLGYGVKSVHEGRISTGNALFMFPDEVRRCLIDCQDTMTIANITLNKLGRLKVFDLGVRAIKKVYIYGRFVTFNREGFEYTKAVCNGKHKQGWRVRLLNGREHNFRCEKSFLGIDVISYNNAFQAVGADTLDLSKIDTSNVVDMEGMFRHATIDRLDIGMLDTSRVATMTRMFAGSTINDINIGSIDARNVTSMAQMFSHADIKRVDMSKIRVRDIGLMDYMFEESKIDSVIIGKNLREADKVQCGAFDGANIRLLDLSELNIDETVYISEKFRKLTCEKLILGYKDCTVWQIDRLMRLGNIKAIEIHSRGDERLLAEYIEKCGYTRVDSVDDTLEAIRCLGASNTRIYSIIKRQGGLAC